MIRDGGVVIFINSISGGLNCNDDIGYVQYVFVYVKAYYQYNIF